MAYRNTPFIDEFQTDVINKGQWYLANYTQKSSWNYASFKPYMVEADNGKLELTLNTADISGKRFTGAEVQSNHSYHYGRYEADIKASPETGVVSTFFVYGGTKLNEIDIELVGRRPNEVHIAIHRDSGSWAKDIKVPFNTTTDYHHYSIDWSPTKVEWYADNNLIYTYNQDTTGKLPSVPDEPIHLVMNLWTGIPTWLGTATFTGETKAYYDNVKFTPLADLGGITPPPPPPPPPPVLVPTGEVRLFLYNADTDQVIGEISDGEEFDIGDLPTTNLAVIAEGDSAIATGMRSVKFGVSGNLNSTLTENAVPWASFGDTSGDLRGQQFTLGAYNVKADAFSGTNGSGSLMGKADIDFTIVDAKLKAYLVDATKDIVLGRLHDGMVIDKDAVGTDNFSILVTTDLAAKSVKFDLNGLLDHTQIENAAPWAMFGDGSQKYNGRTFADGAYTVDIDAYAKIGGTGTLLASIDAMDLLFI